MIKERFRLRAPLAAVAMIGVLPGVIGEAAERPVVFRSQHQAGSTHVAVLSVTRWEDAVEALQPAFKLKEEDALGLAGATTLSLEEKLLNSLQVTLALAPPTSTASFKRTATLEGGEQTTAATRALERAPGTVPAVTAPPSPGVTGLPPATSVLGTATGIEPMLKYRAATALFQEVSLLNRYVKDAIRRRGYDAFVVRMQVSLIPSARLEPYDAYTTMAFFSGEGTPGTPNKKIDRSEDALLVALDEVEAALIATRTCPDQPYGDKAEAAVKQRLDGASNGLSNRMLTLQRCVDDLKSALAKARNLTPGSISSASDAVVAVREAVTGPQATRTAPYVIPLLVTDDIESAAHSRSLEEVRQYAAALSLMIQGFGAGASVGRLKDALNTAVGHDVNSLLTVARVSDNTCRVRFGAMQQVATQYAMVPQTHNVTVLLLVREEAKSIPAQVVARTTFVDARTGEQLRDRSDKEIRKAIAEVVAKYVPYGLQAWNPWSERQSECVLHLAALARQNQAEKFFKEVGEPTGACQQLLPKENGADPTTFPKEALWLDLVSLGVGGQYGSTSFELPRPLERTLFPQQTAVLVDDKKTSTIVLHGKGLTAQGMSAELWFSKVASSQPPCAENGGLQVKPEVALLADRVEISADRTAAKLTFASLENLGLLQAAAGPGSHDEKAMREPSRPMKLRVSYEQLRRCNTFDAIVQTQKPTEEGPKFTLALSSEFIVANASGEGGLDVEFRAAEQKGGEEPPPPVVGFKVTGADVSDLVVVPTQPQGLDRQKLKLDKPDVPVTVKLTLRNLVPNTKVRITAWEVRSAGGADVKKVTLAGDVSVPVVELQPRSFPH